MTTDWHLNRRDPHEDCEPPWYCAGCGDPVCPRCHVSPGEASGLCVECWSTDDPNGDEAA